MQKFYANILLTLVQKCLKTFVLCAFSFKIHSKSCMLSFMLHEITPEEVSNCISKIKSYSAPGMDGIPPKFVKSASCILSPYFAKLFNKCIEQEIFPRDFKVAYVIPIPKSLVEFRPISLLSVFSKLF